jgi:phosphoenolpyruvate-protein kinase (PTS system EI component)
VTITLKQDTVKDMSRKDLESAFVRTQVELQEVKNKKAKTEATKMKRYNAAMHKAIVKDATVLEVIDKMEELQTKNPLALWWVTQWGEEFMQRFKKETGTYDEKDVFDSYTRWTQGTKNKQGEEVSAPAKKTAGMRHWSTKGDSQPASGSATPASAKKSADSPFI